MTQAGGLHKKINSNWAMPSIKISGGLVLCGPQKVCLKAHSVAVTHTILMGFSFGTVVLECWKQTFAPPMFLLNTFTATNVPYKVSAFEVSHSKTTRAKQQNMGVIIY